MCLDALFGFRVSYAFLHYKLLQSKYIIFVKYQKIKNKIELLKDHRPNLSPNPKKKV